VIQSNAEPAEQEIYIQAEVRWVFRWKQEKVSTSIW
jgi:hypothetical protein